MKFNFIQGDCIENMKLMPENSVYAVITSPPYNMNLRVSKGRYISRCNNRNHSVEFATKYDDYDDDLPVEDYFNFQKEFIEQAIRVSHIVFYNIQMVTGNKVALMRLLGEFSEYVKEIIVWDKTRSQPAMKYNTLNSQYEFIIVFDKNKPYNRMFDDAAFDRGTVSNIWKIKPEKVKGFKASFPVELACKIIENFTPPGCTVLDPFMGSGSTGIACKKTDRNFIGIELSENTFRMGVKRIEEYECSEQCSLYEEDGNNG